MPVRNAGVGDCSAANPSISARLRVGVSTHVLWWAPFPQAGPAGLRAEGSQVSEPRSLVGPPVLLRAPPFLSRVGKQEASIIPPSYALGNP
jgi:hypothetical protein